MAAQSGMMRDLHRFYLEVEALAEAVEAGGVGDDPAAEVAAIQGQLEATIAGSDGGEEEAPEARFAMAALGDERFLFGVAWSDDPAIADAAAAAWLDGLLEHRLFQSAGAGDEIFERIEALLASDAAQRELAELYLALLGLGFTGRHADDEETLSDYRARLDRFIDAARGEDRADEPLFPAAYERTLDGVAGASVPTFRGRTGVYGLILTGLALVSSASWAVITQPARADAERLLEAAGELPERDALAAASEALSERWQVLVAAVVVALAAALLYGLWRRREAAADEAGDLDMRRLRRSFSEIAGWMKGADHRAQIPIVLVIDSQRAGTVSQSPPPGTTGATLDEVRAEAEAGCTWWLYEQAILLELSERYLREPDGAPAPARYWAVLASELRALRPSAPVNGAVITLPIDWLQSADADALRGRADQIYDKLSQLVAATALTFPLYAWATGLEQIQGLDALLETLPSEQHDDIFGWSNAADPGAAYDPAWPAEAMEGVRGALSAHALEIFGAPGAPTDGAPLFLFPDRLSQAVEAPLDGALTLLLDGRPLHLPLRGLYFGGGDPAALPLFYTELFFQKVIPEDGLTEAAAPWYTRRAAGTTTAHAAAAALCVGWAAALAFGSLELIDRAESVEEALEQLTAALRALQTPDHRPEEGAEALMAALEPMDTRPLATRLAPISWLSSLDEDVLRCAAVGYDRLALAAVGERLEDERDRLDAEPWTTDDDDAASFLHIEQTPGYDTLQRWSEDASLLDADAASYNALPAETGGDLEGRIEALAALTDRHLDVEIPEAILADRDYHSGALAEVSALNDPRFAAVSLEAMRADAAASIAAFLPALYAVTIDGNRFIEGLGAISAATTDIDELVGVEDLDVLSDLLGALQDVSGALEGELVAWMFEETFAPGQATEALVADLAALLGADLTATPDDDTQARFDAARAEMTTYALTGEDPGSGDGYVVPFLVQDTQGAPTPELDPVLLMIEEGLDTLINERYVATRVDEDSPEGRVYQFWNPPSLNSAIAELQEYEQFINVGLAFFSEDIQETMEAVALDRLDDDLAGNTQTRVMLEGQ